MAGRIVACVEVGGSSVQTVLFTADALTLISDGVHADGADSVLIAVPGLIEDGRVLGASNIGWYDVEPAAALGISGGADLVLNDAEAAALGEAALRNVADLTFVGLGTGVGGAVVRDGAVVATNLLGHQSGFGHAKCVCGKTGCLETVAAGWALRDPLTGADIAGVATALADAISRESLASTSLVIVTGGLARRYPAIVDQLALRLPERIVEPTAAPTDAKSAAAWGLVHAARSLDPARP